MQGCSNRAKAMQPDRANRRFPSEGSQACPERQRETELLGDLVDFSPLANLKSSQLRYLAVVFFKNGSQSVPTKPSSPCCQKRRGAVPRSRAGGAEHLPESWTRGAVSAALLSVGETARPCPWLPGAAAHRHTNDQSPANPLILHRCFRLAAPHTHPGVFRDLSSGECGGIW